jgi:hypothetical protein
MAEEKEKIMKAYMFCLNELQKIFQPLKTLYDNHSNLLDKRNGTYSLFKNLYLNLDFLNQTKSIITTQALVTLSRNIIDNYSVLYLFTSYSTKEEQQLRYYLYLIDSLHNRSDIISDFSEKITTYIPPEGLASAKNSTENDSKIIDYLTFKIENENLSNLVKKEVINMRNWKFKSEFPSKNNSYNWQELSQIAKIPAHYSSAVQKQYSAYVHGLGLSILYKEANDTNVEDSVFSFLIAIQALIGQIVLKEFQDDLKDINIENEFIDLIKEISTNWK